LHSDSDWGKDSAVRFFRILLALSAVLGWNSGSLQAQKAPGPDEEEALKVLQEKIAARDQSEKKKNAANTLNSGSKLTFEEIEALYLDGKITARQFQDYANKLRAEMPLLPPPAATPAGTPPGSRPAPAPGPEPGSAPTRIVTTVEPHSKAVEVLRQTKPDPAINPKPGPAIRAEQIPLLGKEEAVGDGLELTPGGLSEEGFNEIEAKMEELLLLKAARDKASSTNSLPERVAGGEQSRTKRQRLDDLLRQYIGGKLAEPDYNAKRDAIIRGPELGP
jgi:hypothetical protein